MFDMGLRKTLVNLRDPGEPMRTWQSLPVGHTAVVADREPRVLRVKTPRGNLYLVLADDHSAVIDPNLPREWGLVERALAGEGRALGDVAFVGCTHLHFDHASGLDDLAEVTDATLVLPETARPFVDGGRKYPFPGIRFLWPFLDVWIRVGMPGMNRAQLVEGRHIGYPLSSLRLRTSVTRWMADGETVDEFGGLVALAAPGHTPEQMVYLHRREGALLAGDMYITARGHLQTNPIVLDRVANRESDRRLRALGVRQVWPGHGPTIAMD